MTIQKYHVAECHILEASAVLERGDTKGHWRDVYNGFRDRIERGDLQPGDRLPTLSRLADQQGLTVHGARKVMARLRSEGRVESWQGVGHRVSEKRITYRIDERPQFNTNLARLGHRGDTRLLATRVIGLPSRFSDAMGLRAGTRIIQTEVLRFVDGRPLVLAKNFFPARRFEGIEVALAKTQSVTRALAAYGVSDCVRIRTKIETRMPSGHEALQLEIPANQPVLATTGRNVDGQGSVVELSYAISRGDAVAIEI
ncbi:MAG: UTRA domain-containing protein [Pseudomonadota bacterium]